MSAAAAVPVLWHRIARQILRTPESPALHTGARGTSYREFGQLIDDAVATLQSLSLEPGARVGWLGLNSPQMLAMLFACARLALAFVPLNWRLTPAELGRVIRHAGLAALQGTPEMAGLAGEASLAAQYPPEPIVPPCMPGDVLLSYTSGTTGEPRGALHTQAGMVANIDAALAVQPLSAADRVLAVLPMFHVGGLCIQVLPALAVGAQVMLHERFDAGAWLRDAARWRPTTSLLVPAVMRALTEHADWAATDLSSLAFVNSGSQIVPVALIEAFHSRGVPVAQVWGATETGPVSIALPPARARARVGSTGWPAPGVEARLVDAEGRRVPDGETGEIQLRAANLLRAYHREPPGSGFTADGWWASGDLARRDADGSYTVVGRSKELIISGGENIHPAEIEQLAAAWPGVADAVVIGLPDDRWGEVPVLVLQPRPGEAIDTEALRASFEGRLARFKHPRRIELRLELPRTALGKVRRDALKQQLVP